ncbi:CZB domain-containing protein [Halomonas qinghailakensis]|uniref:CZB domain-containing protein n=1 Tax=Halomonas qinghailakensis TaxID=2937790 RepID=A0AA46YP62_9GAMM|nr:CZB domain-containing protein [Halomonas sp. ZZQ-149]UYO75219.1 CZB domain-containing protein [Halomonas sp. ZZQ-149]
MFAFMHPYQTIHRLEQEVAALNAQLEAEKKRQGCRAISLMTPIESLSMLQARGADMLCSLSKGVEVHAQHLATEQSTLTDTFSRLHIAEQTAQTLQQHRQRCQQTDAYLSSSLVTEQAFHDIRQLSSELAHNAGHTKALAITAALEVAHFHEQPAGMPAIVKDLQELSEHSQQLAHQLAQWVERTASHVIEDAKIRDYQQQEIKALTSAAQSAEHVIEQLIDQSRHMYKVIHHSTTTAYLHAAKLEHAVWKSRLYKQLLSAHFEESLEDHQHCSLSHWCLTGDGRRYQYTQAYKALAAPHKRFHESGLDALTFARQGDHNGQLAALAMMEEASSQLALQLDKLMEHAVYETPLAIGHSSPLADSP